MTYTTYQFGATVGTMVNADTVFYMNPRSVWHPGKEMKDTSGGNKVALGYSRSVWYFSWLSIARYHKALAILVGTAGTGTITGTTSSTTIEGASTAFTTELAGGYTVAAHLGSGIYESLIVDSVTDVDTFVSLAKPTTAFSTKAFRYRSKTTYSGTCFVVTRNDVDAFLRYAAVARFKSPAELERSGGKYLDVEIEFILTAIA